MYRSFDSVLTLHTGRRSLSWYQLSGLQKSYLSCKISQYFKSKSPLVRKILAFYIKRAFSGWRTINVRRYLHLRMHSELSTLVHGCNTSRYSMWSKIYANHRIQNRNLNGEITKIYRFLVFYWTALVLATLRNSIRHGFVELLYVASRYRVPNVRNCHLQIFHRDIQFLQLWFDVGPDVFDWI